MKAFRIDIMSVGANKPCRHCGGLSWFHLTYIAAEAGTHFVSLKELNILFLFLFLSFLFVYEVVNMISQYNDVGGWGRGAELFL